MISRSPNCRSWLSWLTKTIPCFCWLISTPGGDWRVVAPTYRRQTASRSAPPRPTTQLRHERHEPHRRTVDRRDAAEIGRRGIDVRIAERVPVGGVDDVDPELQGAPAAERERAHDVQVQHLEVRPAH